MCVLWPERGALGTMTMAALDDAERRNKKNIQNARRMIVVLMKA